MRKKIKKALIFGVTGQDGSFMAKTYAFKEKLSSSMAL